MSERYFDILRRSSAGNCIPSGRQLPRTPPPTDVTRRLDFSDADVDFRNGEQTDTTHQEDQNQALGCSRPEPNEDAPHSMLKGMKGYQLTQSDLEFIKKMKEEQLVKKLQGEWKEVQRVLKNEMMALELACASREKAQAELSKFPSCEELTEWIKMVLSMTSPLMELTDMDAKSLLSMVTVENIQTTMNEKQKDLARIKDMLEKRKQEAEERGNLEKEIASEELKIQGLMRQLSDLKSELAQQEAYKSLQTQMNTFKAPADDLEHAQATTSKVKRSGKERKEKRTKELPDTAIKANSTRRKRTDNQMRVKDDRSDNIKSKALERTTEEEQKQKSGSTSAKPPRPVKEDGGKRKKVEERELGSQKPVQAVGGKQRPAGSVQTAASQAKPQRTANAGRGQSASQQTVASHSGKMAPVAAEDSGQEMQHAGLRRSKRIANRK